MSEHKPKFTQGPWYIKPRTVEKLKYGTFVSRTTVLNALDGGYSPKHVIATIARGNGKEVENAALIACAPEMYALLERLGHALFAENADEWAEEINAMLAKARGEEFQKEPPKT